MTQLSITLDTTSALRDVAALKQSASQLRPLYLAIGESLQDSTIDRFATSTAPDGSKWAPNSRTTLELYLSKFSSFSKKTGKLTSRGAARAANKKPLIGQSKALSTTIRYDVDSNGVQVGSGLIYAATQQFGASKGKFGGKAPWGNIPARPFVGISDDDNKTILELALAHMGKSLR